MQTTTEQKPTKKRGPYKVKSKAVAQLAEFQPHFYRALMIATQAENQSLKRGTFFTLKEIKSKFGAAAVQQFKTYFWAKLDDFDKDRANKLEHRLATGFITEAQYKILITRCHSWRWKLKLSKTAEARLLLLKRLEGKS